MMIIQCIIILLGLIASAILFNRFPELGGDDQRADDQRADEIKLSIIIPARNEEENLRLLLGDLKKQHVTRCEIICVDDASHDNTEQIAVSLGARLISLREKPEGWIGKSWACQNGADAATGNVFLFLDADVRLSPVGICKLIKAYEEAGCVISVQPYHIIVKRYEEFSLFFNFIQMAANGMGLPVSNNKRSIKNNNKNIGLYGPVILMSRLDYELIGGHAAIKDSIIEDMALGEKLKEKDIPFKLFLGDGDISYRMYSGGLKDLIQGWTKNQATGAVKTPFTVFVLVFLWITSCLSGPLCLIIAITRVDLFWIGILGIFYFIWVLELLRIRRHIGSFSIWGIIFYPVLLVVYLGIFVRSMVKKIFRLKVIWKEREI